MTITRAAIYLRMSKDNADGIDRQREECLKLCADKGWEPTEYVDDGVSATTGKARPDYERMLADIRADRLDAVVVWDLDRLHRRPIELEEFIALADAKGLALATVTGSVDLGTHNGRLYARIKGAVARSEMDQKSARQRLAARQLAESGASWWSMRPFGFVVRVPVLDEAGRPMMTAKGKPIYAAPTLDPIESKAVEAAYDSLLKGDSLRSIARGLDALGLRTPRGNRWVTSSQIRQLLMSPRNAGLRSNGDDELIEATWPPIVDRDVFDGALAILGDEDRLCGTSRGRKHLLSNLVLCGGMLDAEGKPSTDPAKATRPCGARMGSGISGRGKPIYVCRACNGISRDGSSVDAMVTEAVVDRLSRADAIELTRPEKRSEFEALRDRKRALQARLKSLGVEFADGELPASTLKSATKRIGEQLETIDTALRGAQSVRTYDGVLGASDVRAAFASLDLDRKRAIVAALLKIEILPTVRGARFRREDVSIELVEDTP